MTVRAPAPGEPFRLPRLRPAADARVAAEARSPFDQLLPYRPAVLAIRVATTAVSLVLAASISAHGNWGITAWCVALTAYTFLRIAQPVTYERAVPGLVRILAEAVVFLLAICTTGAFGSPFLFMVLGPVALVGFASGFGSALRLAATSSVVVAVAATTQAGIDAQAAVQWSIELVMVGLIAGYSRRIMGDEHHAHALALDRLGRMGDANDLLHSLRQVAQTLPSSLDLDEVLDSTMDQLRTLFEADAIAVLLLDDTDDHWVVARSHGSRIHHRLTSGELPPPLSNVVSYGERVVQRDLTTGAGSGVEPGMRSGLYGTLAARERVVGLVAVEFAEPDRVTAREVELFAGLVEPAGLAIDNARLFRQIRTVGADEERNRIARDLHDRIAQSLAYLGFELDRIAADEAAGQAIGPALRDLREDVRTVVGEVRDTLYDLRTDVTVDHDMTTTLSGFVERVQKRSRMEVVLDCDEQGRLPLRQERELWRIAQEAINNAERHAKASLVIVRWRCDGHNAELVVKDDGIGFPSGRVGRLDSYGVLGMRERASSIGATLVIDGDPGAGTTVSCRLGAPAPRRRPLPHGDGAGPALATPGAGVERRP